MAKSWKDVDTQEDIDRLTVTLGRRFGMEPEVYVPLGWATALVLILFWVFVMPGLREYGTVLTVSSSPAGSAVLVDGVLHGATPVELFAPAGTREIRVTHAGFHDYVEEVRLPGRRIGSRFFPPRREVVVVFDQPDHATIISDVVNDFAAWSVGPEPGTQFQHPPVARDGARRLWAQAEGDFDTDTFLRNLIVHARPFQRSDVLGAYLRVQNPGAVFNLGSIGQAVQNFIQIDNEYQGVHRVVADLTGSDSRFDRWHQEREDQLSTDLLALSVTLDEHPRGPIQRRTFGDLSFVRVPAGRYALGYPLRDQDVTGVVIRFDADFWIQTDLVRRGTFGRFVLEHEEWSLEAGRRRYRDYLRDWPTDWHAWLEGDRPAEADLPVRYVPREAAQQFAHWIGEQIGEPVRLPGSAEWEYAAYLNDGGLEERPSGSELLSTGTAPVGALGAHIMSGNLWEWTGNWYGRYSHIIPADHGVHGTVVGGSFANRVADHTLRGGQHPEVTTPFLGFRLAIGRED